MISFRPIFINKCSLSNFFKYKDVLPPQLRSCVIYKYKCPNCEFGEYIGSTERPLFSRIASHQGRSARTNSILSNPEHSAIRMHCSKHKSSISNTDFKIIGSHSEKYSLLLLESLHIKMSQPTLNKDSRSVPLLIA